MKTALICGVSGQDGAYLAAHLLGKGYRVVGTSRDAHLNSFSNLSRLGLREQIELRSMAPTDFRSVLNVVSQVSPTEIYNLAGQSSVALSFEQPVEALESIVFGTLNLLEVIRLLDVKIRLYNAGSSECFGNTDNVAAATETTPFHPRSPYAVAKVTAHWEVASYRDSYGLFACSGILFNHESPLRPERFVTQKIVRAAARIAAGDRGRLKLGDTSIIRDWGWAPEYVDAMWRMLQQDAPRDFVIATGQSFPLSKFVELAFEGVGLDWQDHVDTDPALRRPSEIARGSADPGLAERELGWKATYAMPEVVMAMIRSAQAGVSSPIVSDGRSETPP